MKVIINGISRKDKTSGAGKSYQSVGIKTNIHGDKWLNGFGDKTTDTWHKGMTVYIEVTEDVDYLNFTAKSTTEIIYKIYEMCQTICNEFKAREGTKSPQVVKPYLEQEDTSSATPPLPSRRRPAEDEDTSQLPF